MAASYTGPHEVRPHRTLANLGIIGDVTHSLATAKGQHVPAVFEFVSSKQGINTLRGVTIGDGAVIAAGSVVVSNVDTKVLVGGVPARVLKKDVLWR